MAVMSVEKLRKMREAFQPTRTLREASGRVSLTVHLDECGLSAGARKILRLFMRKAGEEGAADVLIKTAACAGACDREPMVAVEIEGAPPVVYAGVTAEAAERIFRQHVLGGKIVKEFLFQRGEA